MCGRFTLTNDSADLLGLLEIDQPKSDFQWAPSYNIAPTQSSPVLILNGQRKIQIMRWGLIPYWAKESKSRINIFNARSESIAAKPIFQNLLKSQRCIVLANGYFEWMFGKSVKQPFYINLPKYQILPLAGLWDIWVDERKNKCLSYTIITTESVFQLRDIYNRMPVVINYKDIDKWINPESKRAEVIKLFKPYSGIFNFNPVSKFVNSYLNNSPKCIKPITLERK